MCVIASQPAGKTIKAGTLNQMWKRNPDGGGISWIEDGKVQVYKTMKLKDFKKKYKEVCEQHGKHDILIHMRIATHGSVCLDNNHPFYVDPETTFAHNGILPNVFHPSPKSDLSDTRYFNQVFLQHVKPVAFDDPAFCEVVGEMIGSFNKMVFLSANKKLRKETYIINEGHGQWVKGVWYSNTSHIPMTTGKSYTQGKLTSYSGSMKSDVDAWGDEALGWYDKEDGVVRRVDDSCELPIDDEQEMLIEDWYEMYDEPFASTIIPDIAWEDPDFGDMVEDWMYIAGYQYRHIDELLMDYAITWNEKASNAQDAMVCDSCQKPVIKDLERTCVKDCPCKELSQVIRS